MKHNVRALFFETQCISVAFLEYLWRQVFKVSYTDIWSIVRVNFAVLLLLLMQKKEFLKAAEYVTKALKLGKE